MLRAPINRRQTSFSVAMTFDEYMEDKVGTTDRRGRELAVGNCGRDGIGCDGSDKNEQEKPFETQLKSSNG